MKLAIVVGNNWTLPVAVFQNRSHVNKMISEVKLVVFLYDISTV